jgi:hypothetical protein
VLIQKLRWFGRSRRVKDLEDAKNVLAVQAKKLDLNYVRQWTDRHGTSNLLDQLLSSSEPLPPTAQ